MDDLNKKIIALALIQRRAAPGTFTRDPAEVLPFRMAAPATQIERQMPRLEQLASKEFIMPPMPKLQGESRPVTSLVRAVPDSAQTASLRSLLGHEELRYGADIQKLGPFWNGYQGVGKQYVSPEEAKRAALIYAINDQRKSYDSMLQNIKPVRPEISEFASPDAARQSWKGLVE